MYDIVCGERYPEHVSFRRLLKHLHNIEFTYSMTMDGNRAANGINLRYNFALANGYEDDTDEIMDILDGPCSVLEMIVALAIHCEKDIMDDPRYGDRTGQWFWGMIVNLGLGGMTDDRYDGQVVEDVIQRFLDRKYKPDGTGGLFTIRDCKRDLRKVEILHQLNWYLNTIV